MLTNKQPEIGLNELIERIKQELLEEHNNSDPLFLIGKVEIEISFTVERTMNGGVNFQVVQAGVDKTLSNLQKIVVSLEPVTTVDEMRDRISSRNRNKAYPAYVRTYEEFGEEKVEKTE